MLTALFSDPLLWHVLSFNAALPTLRPCLLDDMALTAFLHRLSPTCLLRIHHVRLDASLVTARGVSQLLATCPHLVSVSVLQCPAFSIQQLQISRELEIDEVVYTPQQAINSTITSIYGIQHLIPSSCDSCCRPTSLSQQSHFTCIDCHKIDCLCCDCSRTRLCALCHQIYACIHCALLHTPPILPTRKCIACAWPYFVCAACIPRIPLEGYGCAVCAQFACDLHRSAVLETCQHCALAICYLCLPDSPAYHCCVKWCPSCREEHADLLNSLCMRCMAAEDVLESCPNCQATACIQCLDDHWSSTSIRLAISE